MRILNKDQLLSCGNKEGRETVLSIMEAGLKASDPYQNTMELLHRDGDVLYIGNPKFEADNDPASGIEQVDLKSVGNIYVVGAGKGIQRVALALEEVLGDYLTGGVIICKHGDTPLLKNINVYYGAHPVPDEGCIAGCRAIEELSSKVTENDIVFTIMANGCSSLLTLPEEEVSLEDVRRLTSLMQIEKGVTTIELNTIRNHVDQLKGGKISRLFQKAMQFHLVVVDANHHVIQAPRHDYYGLLHGVWLHSLPESSTFADAIEILHKYNAWEECPESIRKCLENGTPEKETVKYEEFIKMRFRVFGIMPDSSHFLPAAQKEAERLGYKALILSQMLQAEARECGKVYSAIARNIEENGEPVEPPIILLSSSEMVVTVDKHKGVGGRNQEFAVSCAIQIAGSKKIVIASADSDGTDGPGGLQLPDAPTCLGGGIVDGYTAEIARERGISLEEGLVTHATSQLLWNLDSGLHMEQNISLNDLTVILVQK